MIKLTPRQQAIVDFMPRCGSVADIGCDHGRLGAYLLQQGLAEKVIACDISVPSLKKAQLLCKELGLENMIFRAGDGMQVLKSGEADCAVIAGMGGNTIKEILLNDKSKPRYIIAQPMNAIPSLKQCLQQCGYFISNETVVKEGKRFYRVIALEKGDQKHSDDEINFPMPAIKRQEAVCKEYLLRKLELYTRSLVKAKNKEKLTQDITKLEGILKWYQ